MTMHESPVGASVEWFTPPEVFDRLGIDFAMDVATVPGGVPWVPAAAHIDKTTDGLSVPWSGRVWCNPPYGRVGARFMERMADHANGMLLVAARTETRAFQQAAGQAWSVCFLRERLHFIRPDGFQGRAGFGSALLAFGPDCHRALMAARMGWVIEATDLVLGRAA